jgi:hypothetical protein
MESKGVCPVCLLPLERIPVAGSRWDTLTGHLVLCSLGHAGARHVTIACSCRGRHTVGVRNSTCAWQIHRITRQSVSDIARDSASASDTRQSLSAT